MFKWHLKFYPFAFQEISLALEQLGVGGGVYSVDG